MEAEVVRCPGCGAENDAEAEFCASARMSEFRRGLRLRSVDSSRSRVEPATEKGSYSGSAVKKAEEGYER
jgi:hypothetical protein